MQHCVRSVSPSRGLRCAHPGGCFRRVAISQDDSKASNESLDIMIKCAVGVVWCTRGLTESSRFGAGTARSDCARTAARQRCGMEVGLFTCAMLFNFLSRDGSSGCPQLTCRVCKGYWHWESAFSECARLLLRRKLPSLVCRSRRLPARAWQADAMGRVGLLPVRPAASQRAPTRRLHFAVVMNE